MHIIRVSDHPSTYAECDSETQVETREDAIVYLWALAKQDVPQFGVVWLPMGIEPMTNYAMFKADSPASLREKIADQVKKLNEQTIEGLVCQGLNIIYHGLGRHGDDPEFVKKVVAAAKEWAEGCYEVLS